MRLPSTEDRIGRTIAESTPYYPPRAGEGEQRPNIVVILVDDMGFSDAGCFGSEIPTPAIDSLADSGVRFSNFHVTPLCSPTRASLLTGMNHHKVGYAFVANLDPGFPNRSARFPDNCLSLPEALRESGYATMAVGKWHLTPESEMHDAGDRNMWPCQRGFDRFYGFLEALTTLHHPHRLVRDNSPLTVDEYPDNYYLTDDLTDQAIEMIESVRTNDPEKPFFLYFAHAAVHGPLQAKQADIQRFQNIYQQGWSEVAKARLARQKAVGLFPDNLAVADRTAHPGREVPEWQSFSTDERETFAQMMSVYAAMIHSVDESTGRIVDALKGLGELDNTIIVFMSDNGATAEGGPRGTQEYFKAPPLAPRGDERVQLPLDEIGGPKSAMHYPQGWAMSSNTPFRLYKATTHEGGVRSPLIVSWPGRADSGAISNGYQYITDLYPTLLELAKVTPPSVRSGHEAMQIDGESFAATVEEASSVQTRTEQHEEVAGNRSFYSNGWKAVTEHKRQSSFEHEAWELYHVDEDPGETRNLAQVHPDKLEELKAKWEAAAQQNAVFPLDEGSGLSAAMRNPAEARYSQPVVLKQHAPSLERFRASRLVANRSFEVEIDFDARNDHGVLLAHGGQTGGYMVHVTESRLLLEWNDFGTMRRSVPLQLHEGHHVAHLSVTVDAARACSATLSVAGSSVTIDGLTSFIGFAPFGGIDVGVNRRSPVSWEIYDAHKSYPYSGTIHSVRYVPGELAPDAPQRRIDEMRAAAGRFQ